MNKSTVVIWSDYDPSNLSLEDLGREADQGSFFCASGSNKLVDIPEKDEHFCEQMPDFFSQYEEDPDPEIQGKPCTYCGKECEGHFSVHRDGFGMGPEIPLCDACGGSPSSVLSLETIWDKIAQRPCRTCEVEECPEECTKAVDPPVA